MQLIRTWYAVELSSAVSEGSVQKLNFHGEVFAIWRSLDGNVSVVPDRCPHKGASLSAGNVGDQGLACPYHGWCFQSDGACVKIPAQGDNNPIPRRATLGGLPCREQYGYIWIWWDPKGQSAPDDLPALPAVGPIPESDDSGWRSLEGTVVWQANWLRVLEAFMDLTHAPFVHSGSFGAMAPDQLMPVDQWCRDDSVYERVIAPRDRHYRADQGRGLRAWFNQADDKDVHQESDDAGEQHIQLWLANVSLVRVVFGDFQISLMTAHVPMDDGTTRNLWRHFRSFLRSPLADGNARGRVDRFMAEDQRTVETLTPAMPDLDGHGDLLVASDVSTLALRRMLRQKRNDGLLI